MKPTLQDAPTDHRPLQPTIDYQYQAPVETARATGQETRTVRELPGFWKMSTGFFGTEARLDYAAEFCYFCVITALSAWPIVSMMIAVVRYWRNY